MIVVTTEDISHFRIVETKGQVFGLVVRSRGLGGNIMAGLRSLGGGEITEYTQLLEEARRHAVDKLIEVYYNPQTGERDYRESEKGDLKHSRNAHHSRRKSSHVRRV